MKLITSDGKAIKSMIASIGKRSASLKSDIDVAARCCILHAVEFGDITLADALLKAMGDGWRLNALRAWFGEFGPVIWVPKDANTKKEAHFGINKERRAVMLAELNKDRDAVVGKLAKVMAYWEFKPEPEFEGFDLPKEIEKLVAKARKIEADPVKAAKSDLTGIDKLMAYGFGRAADRRPLNQ